MTVPHQHSQREMAHVIDCLDEPAGPGLLCLHLRMAHGLDVPRKAQPDDETVERWLELHDQDHRL